MIGNKPSFPGNVVITNVTWNANRYFFAKNYVNKKSAPNGAAIYQTAGTNLINFIIKDSYFTNNVGTGSTTSRDSAISLNEASLEMSNSYFTDNIAMGLGGALSHQVTTGSTNKLTIDNCHFISNT